MTVEQPLPGVDRVKSLPFLWGAGTSAHQVEGGNDANDWHDWEMAPDGPCVEPAGDACEHRLRYPQDIALLAELGLNCYRFSLEWSRIEPEPGRFDVQWLNHYRRMAQTCHEHGLLALPTLHHFTNPRWIAADGGWLNPATASRFARYCAVAIDAIADCADLVITINEPNMPPLLGHELGVHPPGLRDRSARVQASHNFIDAHRRAVAVIRQAAPHLPVGMALAMADWQAQPGGEAELEEIRRLREDMFLAATDGDDFIGVNTYTRHLIGPRGWVGNEPGVELTAAGYEFWPQALEGTLRHAWARGRGTPLIVTEAGVATDDDERRWTYIDGSIAAMDRAIAGGIDVRGYLAWSALDNFEWQHGYAQRFGLIAVDRLTQRRTVKPSAGHLGRIARRRATAPARPSTATARRPSEAQAPPTP